MTVDVPQGVSPLTGLAARLLAQPGLRDVIAAVEQGRAATVDGAWGSSSALMVSALAQSRAGCLVVVLPRERELDEVVADITSFGIGLDEGGRVAKPVVLPSWPSLPSELSITDPILGSRLRVVRAFESEAPPRVVVTTIAALIQPVPSKAERTVASRSLKVGDEVDLDDLTRWLTARGFERVTAIELPGEFTIHGGIVDVFPPDSADPIRIELFGDEIESIRLFDAETQRKVRDLDEATITILAGAHPSVAGVESSSPQSGSENSSRGRHQTEEPLTLALSPQSRGEGTRHSSDLQHEGTGLLTGSHVLDSLPDTARVVLLELDEIVREGKSYLDRLADPKGLFSVESTLERCSRRGWLNVAPIVAGSYDTTCHLRVESIERFGGPKTEAFKELERVVQQDETVLIACHNEAARQRMAELLREVYTPEPPPAATPDPATVVPPGGMTARNGASVLRSGGRESPESAATSKSSPPLDQMTAGKSPLKRFLKKPNTAELETKADLGAAVGLGAKADLGAGDVSPLNTAASANQADLADHADSRDLRPPLGEEKKEGLRPETFADRVTLCVGHVSRGFRLVTERVVVLSDNELFHRTELQRTPRKSRLESRAIDTFLDLSPGDLVVHLSHGIARFIGMEVQPKGELIEEMLSLEFADKLKMHVPVSLIHLVQKYVGGTKGKVELSKFGGTSWANKKKRVAEAVGDMAADMLKLQAERDLKPGLSCPPDSHWVEEFDAAFPYTETVDQLRAIAETKEDQQRSRPMDRLICGDVGYGKTEIAMRAAFKAVDAGRQVAVLVPTTVLCEQHVRSFGERMAEFPINIASLNRFRSTSEVRETLKGLADGGIDLVIGTHRLVSKDVKFKDLGLLIIDEEQRFGVEVKELLKQMRLEVDVLTLSATPIPRTLHMSLVGVRDISNLETPPHDRIAVQTRICRWDGELIRSSIVRELNRNGQTYFVHNRVYDIETIAEKIRKLVPEAVVDIVHGQMTEDEMEAAMLGFVEGRTDVLVATTIIESGLDIPNANTIFIHQADRYGLADLHQLRGRVGRYKHKSYCYLVLDDGRQMTPQALRRLKAIEEYSELGAGFKISMRDLEIRGAGNILGTEQSGHIASVGYELYCQLLENAVRAIKREPLRHHHHVEIALAIEAYLPSDYIPDGRPKIEMYRKLSAVSSLELLAELKAEFRDRFGPLPVPAERLFEQRELQLLAWRWQIDDIRLNEGDLVLGYRNPRLITRLAKFSHATIRVVDDRDACVILPKKAGGKLPGPKALLRLLKEILQLSPG